MCVSVVDLWLLVTVRFIIAMVCVIILSFESLNFKYILIILNFSLLSAWFLMLYFTSVLYPLILIGDELVITTFVGLLVGELVPDMAGCGF